MMLASASVTRVITPSRSTRRVRARAGAAFEIPASYSGVTPCGAGVLVKVAAAEAVTKGGIVLTESAQRKPTSGDVSAVGPECKQIAVGATVLYSKFGIGCTDLKIKGEDYTMIKESDLIGTLPNSGARANDIPKLQPCGDRVLLAVEKVSSETKGGILLTEGAKEKPIVGSVLAVGPGKVGEDGATKPMTLAVGDKVIYFKYAGDQMSDEDGNQYVVLHENDCLARL